MLQNFLVLFYLVVTELTRCLRRFSFCVERDRLPLTCALRHVLREVIAHPDLRVPRPVELALAVDVHVVHAAGLEQVEGLLVPVIFQLPVDFPAED